MGNLDGADKYHHADEFHKKFEDIDMKGQSIHNL